MTDLTSITPRQVWLAMLAVCTVSYASYLLQRYVVPSGAGLLTAVLGGFYSSTATTVVLARRARTEPAALRQAQTGIVLAASVMYLRLLIIVFFFNRPLASLGTGVARVIRTRTRNGGRLVLDRSVGATRRYATRRTLTC